MRIDFHTHILPGMDDGSASIRESLDMLRAETDMGVDRVVFTPHFYAFQNRPVEFLRRRQEAWQQLLPHMDREMARVCFGAEVLYFEGISRAGDVQRLRILETPYLLVEMPMRKWDQRMVEDVLELNAREDTQVILAHVERYFGFAREEMLTGLLEGGVLFQCNVSFFADRRTRRQAMDLLRRGCVHALGTDCHNMDRRKPNWQQLPPEVWQWMEDSRAYRELSDTFRMQVF